ncbi:MULTISPECIES: magnesium/cobalt transporter CorA [unclassified Mesorhizobium]|uniref:magnesium/cobalt transporter CorA n=1 Tax=unclassified Mesorhizobium TaxID=325217 RepID=UPI000FC9E82E|nr:MULTISPECIES: magnesium/cobalt transporter CorA [unclassified Mesorhizobium]TGP19110.1 magnesium/cobalt transporter CorA [Mesorhizobium sp. M1D.F.Ca.ET.231.01.1.1]TGP25736.1 magnesium/cobalt transporter CorA [Mesorhizobium sp. M1D.F.Ca.ET.234.01.1.1]TGS40547.1 magnesium/cobalt transporter CorA [Mesorhizobium sp. M1D.F.Ca.ET.184.01.1.1]TGS58992.1 magnesium/cobalt transporter CorA [Mesorhizobium sp. M1D.F.Ca.ET.183.01.1.1]
MIKAFVVDNDRLRVTDDLAADGDRVVWADLFNPTKEEEAAIENWLGIAIPTREEMEEIEISSRLYVEDGGYFMTAVLPAQTEVDDPLMSPVTFALAGNRLITIRYHEPKAFKTFPLRAEKVATGCTSGDTILVGLLEAIVDRLADILERAGRDVEAISRDIFEARSTKASKRNRDFQELLKGIGRKEDLASSVRDSLISLQRLAGFLAHVAAQAKMSKDVRARIKTLSRDVLSLADHATFLSQKISFLLDATLGMISIEQNAIIKIFSVAAVIFLPPTLVASIYGMNFDIIPELKWELGYPFAIGLMVVSAILPFWYFRRRGWL